MKKTAFLSALCIFMALLAFSGCEEGHEHNFSDGWSYDKDFHWHSCTGEGCFEISDKAEHSFSEGTDEEGNAVLICSVCGKKVEVPAETPEHEHVFATERSYDENYHWYACEAEDCNEKAERAEHTFGEPEVDYENTFIRRTYTCSVCGYQKVEETEIEFVVKDEASWKSAFDNLEYTNCSMEITFVDLKNFAMLTETSIYVSWLNGARELYSVRNDDGTYSNYLKEYETDFFVRLKDDTDAYYTMMRRVFIIEVSYADYYELFEYDEEEGAYQYDGVIEAIAYGYGEDGTSTIPLYCFNNVVKVENGKIVYMSCRYSSDSIDDPPYSLIYYDIGTTVVKVPEEVINSAIPEE